MRCKLHNFYCLSHSYYLGMIPRSQICSNFFRKSLYLFAFPLYFMQFTIVKEYIFAYRCCMTWTLEFDMLSFPDCLKNQPPNSYNIVIGVWYALLLDFLNNQLLISFLQLSQNPEGPMVVGRAITGLLWDVRDSKKKGFMVGCMIELN